MFYINQCINKFLLVSRLAGCAVKTRMLASPYQSLLKGLGDTLHWRVRPDGWIITEQEKHVSQNE